MLTKADVTDMIYDIKRSKGLSWAAMADAVGLSEVFVTSACLGMNSLTEPKAKALVDFLGLPNEATVVLTEFPTKSFDKTVPTDPCIYRFYEIVGVYGQTLKELIQEKGGDGIMSAIDFDMSVEKLPNPKGDRIEVRMSGKFLSYSAW
ncbi:cyanase [Kordiimonas sp. SCSIO 12610]|uniref:cyanase n=1 Tax=Kordiimonas sp. SCSIO 12610 TaxID=2829597 RepID=UPI00210B6A1A|nr:cyanase [Kordiimonas sp. SCSIO 12610]UTW55349.1 cyanase [Kordiimonas sp. SCSIO 12610]